MKLLPLTWRKDPRFITHFPISATGFHGFPPELLFARAKICTSCVDLKKEDERDSRVLSRPRKPDARILALSRSRVFVVDLIRCYYYLKTIIALTITIIH